MYDVEKRSAVLEKATGFARRDAYIYVRCHNKMADIGVCLYIGVTNFAFPRTLYRSECHRRSFLRGSDTSVCPRV